VEHEHAEFSSKPSGLAVLPRFQPLGRASKMQLLRDADEMTEMPKFHAKACS